MLRVRTSPGARCPPGSRSSMRGREPPKIPPPSGGARRVAPDPVIGRGSKSVRRNRGRPEGDRGRRSLMPLAIPSAIFVLRTRWGGEGQEGYVSDRNRRGSLCRRPSTRLQTNIYEHTERRLRTPEARAAHA